MKELTAIPDKVPPDRMRESSEYAEALRAFLAQKPVELKEPVGRYLTRDEANDRGRPKR